MPARRLTDAHLVIAAGVLTILLGGAAAFIEPPGGSGADSPSSFSASALGARAAFKTLEALGYSIERSFEPMTAVTAPPSATVIVLTGTIRPSEQDRRALQTFVEAGGIVLLAGRQGADFVRVEGARAPRPNASRPSRHRVLAPSALAANATEITMARDAGSPKFGPSYVAVFAVSDDEPLVSTARVGKGRVVWWAAATPLVNAHIDEANNLQLLLNVLGSPGVRRVLWDEHYHGHTRSLWSYASGTALPWVGAQLGLLVFAALLAYSRRRGPVRPLRSDTRSSPLEFIDMLRALYKRAGASTAAVAAARARFRRTVTSACGIPADSGDDVLARAFATRVRIDAGDVSDAVAQADRAIRDPRLSASDALTIVQRLQRLGASL